jgi:hypothetical protein
VKQKKKVNKTKAGNVIGDSITERLEVLKDEKRKLEGEDEDEDAIEELKGIKEETRLLKYNRARLQGSFLGQIIYRP